MSGYVTLSVVDLAIGVGMVAVAAALAYVQRFDILKDLAWGTVRAVLQLSGVGFVLTWVFGIGHPLPLLGVLVFMTIMGARAACKRITRPVPGVFGVVAASMALGSAFVMAYTVLLTLDIEPWFSPRYLIPLAGIVIAFCMNGVALVSDRLTAELHARRAEAEALLSLGASPRRAAQSSISAALRTAWTPLLNHLMVVGVVQLPGMMTGQIIAGASPLDAVRYQILIAFMLTAAVAVSTWAAVELSWRRVFNARAQLRVPDARR